MNSDKKHERLDLKTRDHCSVWSWWLCFLHRPRVTWNRANSKTQRRFTRRSWPARMRKSSDLSTVSIYHYTHHRFIYTCSFHVTFSCKSCVFVRMDIHDEFSSGWRGDVFDLSEVLSNPSIVTSQPFKPIRRLQIYDQTSTCSSWKLQRANYSSLKTSH